MELLNGIFKLFAFIFEKIGNLAKYYPCFGYFDESEVPQELLDEDK
ncbi:cyclic lactone autoinducer peptide AgrD [Staphylococcus simulans]|uniref:AgrD n=1 Tax=Staphylococcus simulans TaxID=1286 RepID=Q8VSW9_STASI|nr:cyclic lactone autoinducer peptide [Staphylococcus simulans]AAL65848.1 AgrD [Staphylococcus simulans]MDT4011979.1 cyclic lactone autoinducer peptide [Staphylococcus simulans]